MADEKMPDPEELRKMFEVLSQQVPELLQKITDVLYGTEQGEKYGQSVAAFYKALRDAGMTNEQAFALTKEYMTNSSLGGMLKNMIGGAAKGATEARNSR